MRRGGSEMASSYVYVVMWHKNVPVANTLTIPEKEEIKIVYTRERYNYINASVIGLTVRPGILYAEFKNIQFVTLVKDVNLLDLLNDIEPVLLTMIHLQAQTEEIPDCDNCDERRGDPPDYSWRD
jgi:hypothetical protein